MLQLVRARCELLDYINLIVDSVLIFLWLRVLGVDAAELLAEYLTHDRDGMLPIVEDVLLEQLQDLELDFRQVRLNGARIQLRRVQLTLCFLARLTLVRQLKNKLVELVRELLRRLLLTLELPLALGLEARQPLRHAVRVRAEHLVDLVVGLGSPRLDGL